MKPSYLESVERAHFLDMVPGHIPSCWKHTYHNRWKKKTNKNVTQLVTGACGNEVIGRHFPMSGMCVMVGTVFCFGFGFQFVSIRMSQCQKCSTIQYLWINIFFYLNYANDTGYCCGQVKHDATSDAGMRPLSAAYDNNDANCYPQELKLHICGSHRERRRMAH